MKQLEPFFKRSALCAAIALAGVFGAPCASLAATNDTTAARPSEDRGSAIVQLNGEPLATDAKTKPARGKKIDFNNSAVKSYRAKLSALRNDYKAWLRANVPGAKVTGEFDIALNAVAVQLNGATLDQVSASSMVRSAQYEGLYHPNPAQSDPDLPLIHAQQAWGGGGPAQAGSGVKVAVVDTGIDLTHPCFSDAGYVAQSQLGSRKYTNNKVIAARVFNNKLNQNHFDEAPVQDHGTHVAGTIGCNFDTAASVNGVAIPYGISGVAPAALLGNYNVFPGDVLDARSEDILNALEAAYQDGFDVANMSLGGGSHGVQDLLTVAVDNLDLANMVVAVAAGNSGPGHNTVESPGMAKRALAAGAMSVPHFVGAPVTAGGSTYGAATGDFAVAKSDLTAPLGVVTGSVNGLNNACAALPAGSLAGKIALISRGSCTFSVKILNAQNAGAAVVLVANNVAGDPTAMGLDDTLTVPQPTVPAYMVGMADGQALKGLNGASTTIGSVLTYIQSANANIMAGFSSQGPTDVDFRVKPDVVAPGVNVLSSLPATACATPPCFAFFSGTSMATPHLAGSAAVVRGQHADWSAADVRSAVVNTADQGVLKGFQKADPVDDVNIIGAGRDNLQSAVGAVVSLDPVSVSFGAVPSGSGQTRQAGVTLKNLSGGPLTLDLATEGAKGGGAGFSVSPATVALAAGESATVTVTMKASVGGSGDQQARLVLSAGGQQVGHAALYTFMK
jgi:minor extracellular serine protease Vpr